MLTNVKLELGLKARVEGLGLRVGLAITIIRATLAIVQIGGSLLKLRPSPLMRL